MSVTSKRKSAKPTKPTRKRRTKKPASKASQAIDRPFDPAILRRAKQLAQQYRLVIEPESEDGYGAIALELPSVFGWGKTIEACAKETRELLVTTLAYMIEIGEEVPSPASDQKRDEQVNVRLTKLEKLRLEELARQKGFRGVSDYVRSRALDT